MVDVFLRVPDEFLRAKLPVTLLAAGVLITGLGILFSVRFGIIPFSDFELIAGFGSSVLGAALVMASFYYWVRPISVWRVIGWVIGINVIMGILNIARFFLSYFASSLVWAIPFFHYLATPVAMVLSTITSILIAIYITYLIAHILTTKTFTFRLNKPVLEVIFTIVVTFWMFVLAFEFSISIFEFILTPFGLDLISVILRGALQILALLCALAAFSRYAALQKM